MTTRDAYPTPLGLPAGFGWSSFREGGVYRERKFRLYCCDGCRTLWDYLPGPATHAVGVAERFADGEADIVELRAARAAVADEQAVLRLWEDAAGSETSGEYRQAAYRLYGTLGAVGAVRDVGSFFVPSDGRLNRGTARLAYLEEAFHNLHHAHVPGVEFRCPEMHAVWCDVFGNLLGTVSLEPAWATDTVLSLARELYATRDFSAMPILADALQDAGCDNADVLEHCRGTLPGGVGAIPPYNRHVRGCWVVDLILGKE